MNPDTFLMIALGAMVALFLVMLVIGIPRGKRAQDTNEKIEANQRKQMEMAARQTAAIERIAEALEKR